MDYHASHAPLDAYDYSLVLSGVAAGEVAVRGVSDLRLMRNVSYLFALQNPIHYRLALYFSLLMQFIELIGESYILSTLSLENARLRDTIFR